MIERLRKLFDEFDVDYKNISEKEVAIPIPGLYSPKLLIPQEQICKDATIILGDEIWIHIEESDNCLNWLAVKDESLLGH